MAMVSYMTVKAADQGDIKGDCKQQGKEDTIMCYNLDHMVEVPKDTHTGLPTGQRIHQPFTVTSKKGPHSPKLFQACCKGEQCEVELKLFRTNDKGQEEHYYTVKLSKAIIVTMREYTPLTFLPESKPYHDMEEVSFTYSKIIWTYEPDGVEAEDEW